MRSPTAALAWEIWGRGRRSAICVFGCLASCALINLAMLGRLPSSTPTPAPFAPLFGILMVSSFLFLFGMFNYTEFNPTKEWNGFPYRLFTLPVRTWQLVAFPMILGLGCVELLYLGWIKLVWTHARIVMPGWFAVVLGAYVVFYQATLWSLAGFRIFRLIVLAVGGVSSVLVASLPFFGILYQARWLSEKRLAAMLVALSLAAIVIAWAAVARQRCGGGRRRSWVKSLAERVIDVIPRRRNEFRSPGAAQFWFEWRRAGWLLPACMAFTLVIIAAPVSWAFRGDAQFTINTLIKVLAMPMVMGFAIGKGFIKPEFWSTSLALPTFVAVRPLSSGEFVASKMKVAAVSVAMAWFLVLAFVGLWLPLWADNTHLKRLLFEFQMLYPHSWGTIIVLYVAGFMVLTWRGMIGGLWLGLSGRRAYYVVSLCLQVLGPSLVLLACGICSDWIDGQIRMHPDRIKSVALSVAGWALALAVIFKVWFAAFSWSKSRPRRTWQYVLIWSGATACFVALAILSRPVLDTYRLGHLYLLGALLVFPLARVGMAPWFLRQNRHR